MSLALAIPDGSGAVPAAGGRVLLIGLAVSLGLHGAAVGMFAQTEPMPAALVAAGAGGDENETLAAIEATFVDLSPPEVHLPAPRMALPLAAPVIEIPRVVLPDPVLLPPEPPKVPPPEAEPPPPRLDAPKPVPKRADPPKPTPKTPSKPAPEQNDGRAASRAAGSGTGVQAGARGSDAQALASAGKVQELLAKWGAAIRSRVERRKRAPAGASRATGAVTVAMTINRSGQLTAANVARSSGNAALDAAALAAVRSAGKFPPAPAGLDKAAHGFTLVIKFGR